MEGLEDLFENILGASSFDDPGVSLDDILSGDISNVDTPSFGDNNADFDAAMSAAFEDVNKGLDAVSFTGQFHHEPFDGELSIDNNGSQITFEGNGDKYTDNDYNREQADKWLAKEQDCLAKGDTKGAASAHSTAMKHIGRIKK